MDTMPPVVAVPSYCYLRPGSSKINTSLRNLNSRNITVKAKSIVAQLAAANVVPSMLTPKNPQELGEYEDKQMKMPNMSSKEHIKVQLTKEN